MELFPVFSRVRVVVSRMVPVEYRGHTGFVEAHLKGAWPVLVQFPDGTATAFTPQELETLT